MSSPKKTSKISITLFHMNGCGYCVAFTPTWNELVKWCKEHNIKTYDYEAKELHEMLDPLKNNTGIQIENISGFPTIIILKDGIEEQVIDRHLESITNRLSELLNESDEHPEIVQTGGKCNGSSCSIGGCDGSKQDAYYAKYLKYKHKYLHLLGKL